MLLVLVGPGRGAASDENSARRVFDVQATDAELALRIFAKQAAIQLLFDPQIVDGVKSNEVRGEFSIEDGLGRLLADSRLLAVRDSATGVFSIKKSVDSVTETKGERVLHDAPNKRAGHSIPSILTMSKPYSSSKPRRSLWPRLLSTLAVFTASQLNAQTPAEGKPNTAADEVIQLSAFTVSASNDEGYRATEAVSASRLRAPLIDTPASISVLTRSFLDDIAPDRLFDAARFVAGVSDGRFSSFQNRMVLRGFETFGVNVDNFIINSTQNYDEVMVDRIEVAKGPNAILSPAGVPGGTINLVSKSPQFTTNRSLKLMAGLYDAQRAELDMTGPVTGVPKLAYRLIAMDQDSRREWSTDSRLRRQALSPQVTYNLTPDTSITTKLRYQSSFTGKPPMYIVAPSVVGPNDTPKLDPQITDFDNAARPNWAGYRMQDYEANAFFTSRINDHINLRVAGDALRSVESSVDTGNVTPGLANRYNPFTGIQTPDYTWAKDSSGNYVPTFSQFFNYSAFTIDRTLAAIHKTTVQGQADLSADYKLGPVSTQTVVGCSVYNEHDDNFSYAAPRTTYNLAAGDQILKPAPTEFTKLNQGQHNSELDRYNYVNERLGFFSDRLLLNGGYLHYSTVKKSVNIANSNPVAILDSKKDMKLASVVAKPLANLSVYSDYSTNAQPQVTNNRPFWSEGKQFEYGVKSEFLDKRLGINVAHFQITVTNQSTPNPAYYAGDFTQPISILSDVKNHGWEFEVTGQVTKSLSVLASYTEMRFRDSLGRRQRGLADRFAGLAVNYRFSDGLLKGFATSLSASYSGDKPGDVQATNATPLNVLTQHSILLKAYTVANFSATYQWNNLTFGLYVDNVFDYDGVTEAGGRTGLELQPRRNVRLSTTIKF